MNHSEQIAREAGWMLASDIPKDPEFMPGLAAMTEVDQSAYDRFVENVVDNPGLWWFNRNSHEYRPRLDGGWADLVNQEGLAVFKAVRCVVACRNSNGEPEFFPVVVNVTDDEYEDGVHYHTAKRLAGEAGHEDICWCCDENDPAFGIFEAHDDLRNALDSLHGEFMSRMQLVRPSDWTPEENQAEHRARQLLQRTHPIEYGQDPDEEEN